MRINLQSRLNGQMASAHLRSLKSDNLRRGTENVWVSPEAADRPKIQSCSGIGTQRCAERFLKAGTKTRFQFPAFRPDLRAEFPGRLGIEIITQIEARIPRKRTSISDCEQPRGFAFRGLAVPETASMMGTLHRTRKDQTRKI